MGSDKARLTAPDGRELWAWQLEKLRALAPREVLLSCRPDQAFDSESIEGVRIAPDRWPDAGPLGGIVSCLEALPEGAELLLALAVDLPGMPEAVLRELVEACLSDEAGRGAVFVRDGFFEPLAAVYPRTMAAEGRRRLGRGEYALQPWLRQAVEAGLTRALPWRPELEAAFANLNTPEDFARWRSGGRPDARW